MTRAAALLLALTAACHHHHHGPAGGPRADEYFHDCDQAPDGLRTFATDESFAEMINKEAAGGVVRDDAQAAHLAAPPAGSVLSASVPPTFTLRVGTMAAAPATGRPARACAARRPRAPGILTALAPIGTAHAHCAPVNGENFLLRVTAEGDSAPLYAAQLSVTSFTPGAEAWRRALGGVAGRTVTVTVLRAIYGKGTITNGPFAATTPARFTVGP